MTLFSALCCNRLRRTYINRNDFKFQLSLTREFELSGLFAQVSFIKEAVEHLIDAKVGSCCCCCCVFAWVGVSAFVRRWSTFSTQRWVADATAPVTAARANEKASRRWTRIDNSGCLLVRLSHCRARHAVQLMRRYVYRPNFMPSRAALCSQGTASINLYVDQDFAAIFLDLRGEINVLPDLPVPRVNGELGVLMVVAFGSVSAHAHAHVDSSFGGRVSPCQRGAGAPLAIAVAKRATRVLSPLCNRTSVACTADRRATPSASRWSSTTSCTACRRTAGADTALTRVRRARSRTPPARCATRPAAPATG